MKNRDKQRMNRRIVNELLSLKDICGTKDPTPYEAVKEIIRTSVQSAEQKGRKTTSRRKNE